MDPRRRTLLLELAKAAPFIIAAIVVAVPLVYLLVTGKLGT